MLVEKVKKIIGSFWAIYIVGNFENLIEVTSEASELNSKLGRLRKCTQTSYYMLFTSVKKFSK